VSQFGSVGVQIAECAVSIIFFMAKSFDGCYDLIVNSVALTGDDRFSRPGEKRRISAGLFCFAQTAQVGCETFRRSIQQGMTLSWAIMMERGVQHVEPSATAAHGQSAGSKYLHG